MEKIKRNHKRGFLLFIMIANLLMVLYCSDKNAISSDNIDDFIKPPLINDLQIEAIDLNKISISWTAPSNSQDTLLVAWYDLRYHTDTLTESNWLDAHRVNPNISQPGEPESLQTFDIVGLYADIKYYIAIRVSDYYGRRGAISNVVTGTIQSVFGVPKKYDINGSAMAVCDLDSDGDLDLVITKSTYLAGNFIVMLNNGSGQFSKLISPQVEGTPWYIQASDFDNDGDCDLAVTGYILLNDGFGNFLDSVIYLDVPGTSIDVGDFDGDGDTDIVAGKRSLGTYGAGTIRVHFNNGEGVFDDNVLIYEGGDSPMEFSVIDTDNDGDLDIVVRNEHQYSIQIYCNSGNGRDWIQCNNVDFEYSTKGMTSTDLTNNGIVDLVITTRVNLYAALNDGTGGFSIQPPVWSVYTGNPLPGDFNRDGFNDIVVVQRDSDISLCLNDGAGNFLGAARYSAGEGTINRDGVVGDFNGDGYDDVAVIQLPGNLLVFLNVLGKLGS